MDATIEIGLSISMAVPSIFVIQSVTLGGGWAKKGNFSLTKLLNSILPSKINTSEPK